MSQGKAFNKEKILESLKPYFLLGYNRAKACMFANFDPKTLSKWEEKDEELSIKIDSWINYVNSKAREVVAKSITDGNSKEDAKWWLERNLHERKEFSTRVENDTTSGGEKITDITVKFIDGNRSDSSPKEDNPS